MWDPLTSMFTHKSEEVISITCLGIFKHHILSRKLFTNVWLQYYSVPRLIERKSRHNKFVLLKSNNMSSMCWQLCHFRSWNYNKVYVHNRCCARSSSLRRWTRSASCTFLLRRLSAFPLALIPIVHIGLISRLIWQPRWAITRKPLSKFWAIRLYFHQWMSMMSMKWVGWHLLK